MTGLRNYNDKVKKYFPFSAIELRAFVISVLCLTFIVAFNDKSESFNAAAWSLNFLRWLVIVGMSFFVFQAGHRLVALKLGLRAEYKMWWHGLLIGVVVMLVTRGSIWFLLPGGVMVYHMRYHRLGHYRYGLNMSANAAIAVSGPIAAVLFATLIKTLQIWFGLNIVNELFVNDLYIFNLLLAAMTLLPIPPLPGNALFFYSRLTFAFVWGCFAGYAILALMGVFSYFLALLIGGLLWFLYLVFYERKI